MKKALTLIVVVLLLTNCEDSNVVGPVSADNQDEIYTIEKFADPNANEILLVLYGTAKFNPEDGSGGYIGKRNMYYPSTMFIGEKYYKVNIIRELSSAPANYDGGPERQVKGIFKIVERANNSIPNGSETVLFIGKYQIQFNLGNTVDEVIYTGNGRNEFLGTRLTVLETLFYERRMNVSRNKIRKWLSFPDFTSQLNGEIKQTLLDSD